MAFAVDTSRDPDWSRGVVDGKSVNGLIAQRENTHVTMKYRVAQKEAEQWPLCIYTWVRSMLVSRDYVLVADAERDG